MSWKTLDTRQLVERREQQHEMTTSGNAGGYTVPLGRPLRAVSPAGAVNGPVDELDAETRRLLRELYGIEL